MSGPIALADLILELGIPDPVNQVRELTGIHTLEARRAAETMGTTARAIAAATATATQSLAQLARGWSNPAAAVAVGRLLSTAEATAALLARQAAAIDVACAFIDRAQSDAGSDIAAAAADIHALQRTTLTDLLGAAVGAPRLA